MSEHIDIEEKIEKLAKRRDYYALAKETTSKAERIDLYNRSRKLADEIYTPAFIEFLNSKPIGYVIWSDDDIKAVTANNTSSFARYDIIVKLIKNRGDKSESHVYFDKNNMKLLLDLDQDALKLYCNLHERKVKARKEELMMKNALKAADANLMLHYFNDGTDRIVLDDGRSIVKYHYMGHPCIKIEQSRKEL